MSSSEPGTQPYRAPKPIGVVVLGLFSIVSGPLLFFTALALATIEPRLTPLWPLVALGGIGYFACGIGLLQGKSWAWALSVLVCGLSFLISLVQASLRLLDWGIFFLPAILAYLVMPQVQGFFTQPFAEPPSPVETETNLPEPAHSASHPPNTGPLFSRTSIFTGAIILCMIIAVPGGLAASVHLVSVTSVTLNIAYSGNTSIQWFGLSPRDVSGPLFDLGNDKMQFRFSLSNLGFFESHTINSLSMVTPGFVLYSPGLPVSIPDLATVTLSVQLQAPDQNYYGPVTIQIQTS